MSRKQWIGLVILLLIVTAAELCFYFTDRWLKQQEAPYLLVLQPEREDAFHHYLDSLSEAEQTARRALYATHYRTHPQPFDPNTADSALLVTVGLKPWMAHNLIRYRTAGKVFRQKDDLRRLYGMTDSLYATLAPYIQIDTTRADSFTRAQRGFNEVLSRLDTLFPRTVKRDTILDLNTADTAELQLLRGVGRYTAIQILRYRRDLGGYHSTNQLYEIAAYYRLADHFPTDRIDSLLPHLIADKALITPIAVNSASVRILSRHPYISYPQAEQIYNLRRRKHRLHAIEELSAIFTPDELQRLAPYLSLE